MTKILLLCNLLIAIAQYADSLAHLKELLVQSEHKTKVSRRREADAECEGSHVVDYHNSSAVLHIRFPKVVIDQDDQYLCTALKVPFHGQDSYITQYIPHTSATSTHHMLVYGCSLPSRSSTSWNCGTMGQICKERGSKIIYAWAKNAPSLTLPENIGYRIGDGAGIKYLVVQMHYAHKTKPGQFDCSGFSAVVTQKPQPYTAGVFLVGSDRISIPSMSKYSKSDASCTLHSSAPLHVFAFRTHAHSLGTVITGYRYRDGKTTMIGKGNPQWPHAFYPRVGGAVELRSGDVVLARCVYVSNRSINTHVGMRGDDEMCNFYMMYYTSQASDQSRYCWDMSVRGAESLFPQSADDLAPYPGFAGQDSIQAIASGLAVPPPVPAEHHHHHHGPNPPEKHVMSTAKTRAVTSAQLLSPPKLTLDATWSPPASVGQVGGVAVDRGGALLVFHRADRVWDWTSFDFHNIFRGSSQPITADTLLVLDPHSGAVLESWGGGFFYMPHGLSVDGEDNVWLTDVALHQVMKFGRDDPHPPLLTLGEKMVPGNDRTHFCKPADVAVDEKGFIYVADGYCNSRVVKFDAQGRFVTSWGEHGISSREQSAKPSFFNLPHSIVLAGGEVCVADRENGRVQCFDTEGRFLRIFQFKDEMGDSVYAITYAPPNHRSRGLFYAVNGEGKGSVRSCGFSIDAESGGLLGEWCPSREQQLSRPHDVTVSPSGGSVYVGQLSGRKLYKFISSARSDHGGNPTRAASTLEVHPQTTIEQKLPQDGDSEQHGPEPTRQQVKPPTTTSHRASSTRIDVEDQDRIVVIIMVLLIVPLLAAVLACVVVCNRKRRLKQYQDLLGHDVIQSYGYPTQKSSFFSTSIPGRKGFTAIRSDDVSDDDSSDNDDTVAMIRQ